MQAMNPGSLSDICAQLSAQKLPRWEELPDLELYMDQVLALIQRYLGSYPGYDEKGLTASMVNNYVKMGVVPPPKKKRYTRIHLAHLILICVLKASLPIAAIQQLIALELQETPENVFYDRFCALFEQAGEAVAAAYAAEGMDAVAVVCRAALRAQAEQALASRLLAAALPTEKTED